ncbi:LLM class flavin-dependent oxidoreductase [Actinoplanes aureus]|uniref:LLM class flavin-dependent oxidoreductase n=1 Tax=Actinoplanes aureus TaxID=2792083 RepID=UPI001E3410A7|nr:LLM class flavin-dependent oxidoreductase [Actinoplanes aureus]
MRFLLLSLITWIDRSKSIQQRAARTSRIKLWTGVTTLSLLDKVTWSGRYRPSLTEAETWPRPLQQPITVWHGSATSKASVDLAASYGDPLFSAYVTNPIEPYAELIDYYRERWAHHGHDPAAIRIGAGSAGFYAARSRSSTRCTAITSGSVTR